MKDIKLINDTIDKEDLSDLINWLNTNPRLTKGDMTSEFEKKWSNWLGRRYSVYVNSGSSANLLMVYSLLLSNKLRNKKIVVPSVSWVTTVTPVIQLGLEPILCECDKNTLGIDIDDLKNIIKKEKPAALIIVHVLAFPCKMKEILQLCKENNVLLLEDSCESIGSKYKGIKTGNFGLMSTFSFYYGHHMSTIEGGMISTDDEELYEILLSIRAHGWDRDLSLENQLRMRKENNIDDFKALFTFYYAGFNVRSTDLQAFIGLNQIKKIDTFSEIRSNNFKLYDSLIKNEFWKISILEDCYYSNFAYPIITPNIASLVEDLKKNRIESRPLVCGSIGLQPFWKKIYGQKNFIFADIVHNYGMYLPNNQNISKDEISLICEIVNKHTIIK